MKAVVLSYLLSVKNGMVSTLIFVTAFCAVFVITNNGETIMAASAGTAMLTCLYAFSFDSSDSIARWGSFKMTLPVSRKTFVVGRYAATLILGAITLPFALIVCTLTQLGMTSFASVPIELSFDGMALTASAGIMGLAAAFLFSSINFPVFLRFGQSISTRMLTLGLTALMIGSVFALVTGMPDDITLSGFFATWSMGSATLLISALCLVASLVIFCASSLLSIRLFAKREL